MDKIIKKYGVVKYEKLNKGWSRDTKLILTDKKENKYLLRISNGELFEKKKEQFELLQRLKALEINCSKPIEFGRLSDGRVYTLLSWLEGISAEESVSKMSDLQAYNIGVEGGKALKELHKIPVKLPDTTWWQKYSAKIPKKIENLKNSGLGFEKQDIVIEYVLDNMSLVKNREQAFSHADYHVGNMIVNNGKIGVIDFDKNTVADTYDDFKPFCWNVFASEYFQTGLINGYFNGDIPKDFFAILALYAGDSLLSHLPWALRFGDEEVKTANKVINSVLLWYDNFNLTIPTWYKGENPFKEIK
ncbi:MAG: phosphotransferase [Clostridia bacterium]|nr:phosphotransferase [Clostridia bacterium]